MAPRITRLERITNLVLALLGTSRPLSLREIGASVAGYPGEPHALRQAFERDKRTLRDGGIQVSVERVGGDEQVGYRILPEEYYLPDLGLSEEESEALAFALTAVRLEGSDVGDVTAKLGAKSAEPLAPLAVLPSLPALGALQEAIRRRSVASFAYHGRARAVEGYGLVFREGSWYFVGYDHSAGGVRTFRVDRIDDDPSLGPSQSFSVPDGLDVVSELRLAPFRGAARDGATEVVLEVDVRAAAALRRAVGAPPSRALDGGSLEYRFRVADEEALVSYLLSLGDAVVVREPAALAARVSGTLEAIAASSRPRRRASA